MVNVSYPLLYNISKLNTTIWFLFNSLFSLAQANTYYENNFGVNVGVQVCFGTHIQGIGIFTSAFYGKDFYQFNTSTRLSLNRKNIGQTKWHREFQIGIGTVVGIEKAARPTNYFLSLVSNQIGKKYSIGYGYKLYFDNKNTSQRTGVIGFQIDQLDIFHENDILATSGSDRYRTAGIYIGYRIDSTRIGVNTTLWHGNSNSPLAKNNYDTSFARYGYKDLSLTEHGRTSHGLISIQGEQSLQYGQIIRANFGIDSERVRNVIQNKIIHDMYFLPKKWIKTKNLHIPMLDENGNPYIYKQDQKLKNVRFFLQTGINSPMFY